jgi:hypothetical protein
MSGRSVLQLPRQKDGLCKTHSAKSASLGDPVTRSGRAPDRQDRDPGPGPGFFFTKCRAAIIFRAKHRRRVARWRRALSSESGSSAA